jgi:hypothetical protein
MITGITTPTIGESDPPGHTDSKVTSRLRRSQAVVVVLHGIRMSALRVFGIAFVVFTALAVHAARGFEDVLRVEAAEGSRLQNLVH